MNNRKAIALAGLGAVCVGAAFLFFKKAAKSPEARFGARRFAAMNREARDLERNDKPSEAVAYYVNRRTGPIVTRDPALVNRLQNGPLDPQLYLTAIAAARATPGIVSGTGAIMVNATRRCGAR